MVCGFGLGRLKSSGSLGVAEEQTSRADNDDCLQDNIGIPFRNQLDQSPLPAQPFRKLKSTGSPSAVLSQIRIESVNEILFL